MLPVTGLIEVIVICLSNLSSFSWFLIYSAIWRFEVQVPQQRILGYYVDTVGKNETRIAEYIRNQLKEDKLDKQMTITSISPFTGSK